MHNDISVWFLFAALFLPRLTLFFGYFAGGLPPNTTPFFFDAFSAIFIPRILVMIWIYQSMGACAWFFAYLIVSILGYLALAVKIAVAIMKSRA